jgi:CBS domain-containing protein
MQSCPTWSNCVAEGENPLKTPTGAMPLHSIEAMALDTETTGLDPAVARIIEFGSLQISRGIVVENSARDMLINPGIAIPPKSTEVHGIKDADVTGAPAFSAAYATIRELMGARVVVGHNIGFDLAIMEAEARRSSIAWKRPRFLCVRMLGTLAAPSLASHSLDAMATWLGIEVKNRHRALGDAEVAARIFIALIPKLRQIGIGTLAEAERALLRLSPQLQSQENSGWSVSFEPPNAGRNATSKIDSASYRHTVGDVMAHPVVVVPSDMTLEAALRLMVERTISSVFVADRPEPGLPVETYGILTERDVMRRIGSEGASAFASKVGAVASRPIESIRENAFVYRAIGRMSRLRYRHLAVRNDEGMLTGIVSARDLLKVRAGPTLVLDDGIETAKTPEDLATAWSTLPAVVNSLLSDEVDARIVCRIVSEEIRSMTRRAAQLAEEGMREAGKGSPPCAFSVLVLGSGGRGESMLVPDQDNAIVYERGDAGSTEDLWFAEMAGAMSDILDEAGIPLCKGGVMARNPQWRGSKTDWLARIEAWVRQSRPEDLLNVDIFFDAVPVHGNYALGQEIFDFGFAAGHASTSFAKLLGENVSTIGNPLTLFGGFRTDGNRLDLKKHILFPISAAARALAIRHNIARRSTRDRLEGLASIGIGSSADIAALADIHRLGIELVLAQQSSDIEAGLKPGTLVDVEVLGRERKSELKEALKRIQVIPDLMRNMMFSERS